MIKIVLFSFKLLNASLYAVFNHTKILSKISDLGNNFNDFAEISSIFMTFILSIGWHHWSTYMYLDRFLLIVSQIMTINCTVFTLTNSQFPLHCFILGSIRDSSRRPSRRQFFPETILPQSIFPEIILLGIIFQEKFISGQFFFFPETIANSALRNRLFPTVIVIWTSYKALDSQRITVT